MASSIVLYLVRIKNIKQARDTFLQGHKRIFIFLKSILFNKFIISSHAIFYEISPFWEYEELKWFTDITKIIMS